MAGKVPGRGTVAAGEGAEGNYVFGVGLFVMAGALNVSREVTGILRPAGACLTN